MLSDYYTSPRCRLDKRAQERNVMKASFSRDLFLLNVVTNGQVPIHTCVIRDKRLLYVAASRINKWSGEEMKIIKEREIEETRRRAT